MSEEPVPRKFLLQWHLTDACNLRCHHCYGDDTSNRSEMPFEQSLDVFHQFLHFLQANGMTGHINFTGGEPLLYKNLPMVLQEVYRHRGTCTYAILSNGSLIDHAAVDFLQRTGCRFVQVSVDGGPDTHDAMRGSGSYNACRNALRILRRKGIATMVSFTVSRANMGDFSAVVNMARSERVNVVWSDRLLPSGRGRELADFLMTPDDVDEFFEKMFRIGSELQRRWFCRTRIRMHRALQFRTLQAHGIHGISPYRCNAGRGLLTLMPDGTVYPCRRLPIHVGNVTRNSLEDIFWKEPFLQALRNEKHIALGCESCEWRASCGGGLRCLAFACTGDPFRADPQCSLADKRTVCAAHHSREPLPIIK